MDRRTCKEKKKREQTKLQLENTSRILQKRFTMTHLNARTMHSDTPVRMAANSRLPLPFSKMSILLHTCEIKRMKHIDEKPKKRKLKYKYKVLTAK